MDGGEGNLDGSNSEKKSKKRANEKSEGELSFAPPSSSTQFLLRKNETGKRLTSRATVIPNPLLNPLRPSVLQTILAASKLLPLSPYTLV